MQRRTITVMTQREPFGQVATVGCPHGTTTVMVPAAANGTLPEPADATRAALHAHYHQAGCRCTVQLRRQYGVVVRPRRRRPTGD